MVMKMFLGLFFFLRKGSIQDAFSTLENAKPSLRGRREGRAGLAVVFQEAQYLDL